MSLGESIRGGTKWLVTGNLGGRLLQFIFGIVLARLLVPADFGMLVTIQIFTGIAGYFAGGGMGEALVQAKKVEPYDYKVIFCLQLMVGFVIFGIFFLVAPWFAQWFGNPLYVDLMRVSALSFLLRPFSNMPSSILRREMRFKSTAKIMVITMLLTGIASIVMAMQGMGVWSLVLGGLLGSIVSIVMLSWVTGWKPGFGFDKKIVRRLGGYGIKVSANEMIVYLREQTSNFIISRLIGATMVGLYNKADSLGKLPFQIISGSVYQPVFRALSQEQDDVDKSKYIYFRTILLLTVYTLPFYIGLWWLAEPFISIVYGEQWLFAAQPLSILSIAGIFLCVSHPSGALLAARNLLGLEIKVQIIAWLMVIVGGLIGIQWGISGVAWSVVITQGYFAVHMYWYSMKAISVTCADLVKALAPGFLLNIILLFVFIGAHIVSIARGFDENPLLYFTTMSSFGCLAYVIAFLYMPIPELKNEAEKWKGKLGRR